MPNVKISFLSELLSEFAGLLCATTDTGGEAGSSSVFAAAD
jgi:hypothetical protein